ncbi:uncharacterized protein CBL_00752 [Carabus blaptoides fortunei]
MKKKDLIEKEIKELGSILTQNGVGMNDPLVDSEGFPLAHVDIYQVRYARNRIICLQNDHKAIMKEIEKGLGTYYSSTDTTFNSATASVGCTHRDNSNLEPFAKISNVAPGSPADEASLQNDDYIVEFGSVNAKNFKDMNTVAEIVRHSANIELLLRVRRGARVISVNLRPHRWTGKGLLGCLITPIDVVDR